MNTKLDTLGIGLSGLCLLHCVATPVFLILAPALAALVPESEWVHITLLAIALPLSLVAFSRGLNHHKSRHPDILGAIGLAALGLGLALPAHETSLTIGGVLFLATGHLLNRQRLAGRPA